MPRDASTAHSAASRMDPYARSADVSFLAHRRSFSDQFTLQRPPLLDYSTIPRESYQRPTDYQNETFLRKLWYFILDHERQCTDPVLHWSRTRRYLLIPDEARLVQEVAVVLFKQKDYSSFARQLNIYNFKRCSQSQIRELRDVEDIPEGCKVWVHPFLHGDSPLSELSKVRRHASSKKARGCTLPSSQHSLFSHHPISTDGHAEQSYRYYSFPKPFSSGGTETLTKLDCDSSKFWSVRVIAEGNHTSSKVGIPLQQGPLATSAPVERSQWTTSQADPALVNENSLRWPCYSQGYCTGQCSSEASPCATSSASTPRRISASAQLSSTSSEVTYSAHIAAVPAFRLEHSGQCELSQADEPRSLPDRRTSLEQLVEAALTA